LEVYNIDRSRITGFKQDFRIVAGFAGYINWGKMKEGLGKWGNNYESSLSEILCKFII